MQGRLQHESDVLLGRLLQLSWMEIGPVLGSKTADRKADLDQLSLGQGGQR